MKYFKDDQGRWRDVKGRFASSDDVPSVYYDPQVKRGSPWRDKKTNKFVSKEKAREEFDQETLEQFFDEKDYKTSDEIKEQDLKHREGVWQISADDYAYYDPETGEYYAGSMSSYETGQKIDRTTYKKIRAGAKPYLEENRIALSLLEAYDQAGMDIPGEIAERFASEWKDEYDELQEEHPDLDLDEIKTMTFKELDWEINSFSPGA